MERFTLPEALQDTNDKFGENVQSIVRPLTDPSVRTAKCSVRHAGLGPSWLVTDVSNICSYCSCSAVCSFIYRSSRCHCAAQGSRSLKMHTHARAEHPDGLREGQPPAGSSDGHPLDGVLSRKCALAACLK